MNSLKFHDSNYESTNITIKKENICGRKLYKNKYKHMMFCNGGDRTNKQDTPEHIRCEQLGIKPVYGLGEKIQSSSWLTK